MFFKANISQEFPNNLGRLVVNIFPPKMLVTYDTWACHCPPSPTILGKYTRDGKHLEVEFHMVKLERGKGPTPKKES